MASLPYTLTMVGFGLGGVLMGRLSDRFGVIVPVLIGATSLGLGFVAAGAAPSLLVFALAQGAIIGFLGSSATFAPLVADISFWFSRRRGLAVAICISGNYLAGALRNPSAADGQFGRLIFGFAVTEALGIFSLLVALVASPWFSGFPPARQ